MNDEIHNYHDAGIHANSPKLIKMLYAAVDFAEQLKIERNAWRFKAEELEKERNQWVAEWGDLKTALQKSRRLAAELGIKLGENRCPECGSRCLALLHGMFPTGVTGPDGEQETWYECAINCQDCGHVEEVQ